MRETCWLPCLAWAVVGALGGLVWYALVWVLLAVF
jgi:hypothetical protein